MFCIRTLIIRKIQKPLLFWKSHFYVKSRYDVKFMLGFFINLFLDLVDGKYQTSQRCCASCFQSKHWNFFAPLFITFKYKDELRCDKKYLFGYLKKVTNSQNFSRKENKISTTITESWILQQLWFRPSGKFLIWIARYTMKSKINIEPKKRQWNSQNSLKRCGKFSYWKFAWPNQFSFQEKINKFNIKVIISWNSLHHFPTKMLQ